MGYGKDNWWIMVIPKDENGVQLSYNDGEMTDAWQVKPDGTKVDMMPFMANPETEAVAVALFLVNNKGAYDAGTHEFHYEVNNKHYVLTVKFDTETLVVVNGHNYTHPGAYRVYPGTIAMAATTDSVQEDEGTIDITVTRTGGTDGEVTVDYTTVNGTAEAGTDYTTESGTLTWADGDGAAKIITVTITDRSGAGDDGRNFTVALSNEGGGATQQMRLY